MGRPLAWAMRLEHDGSHHLCPVHHQRRMTRGLQLCGARVGTQALRPFPGYQPHLAVGRTGTDGHQGLCDPTGNELIVPRGVRSLVELDVTLAVVASVLPGFLTGQNLGKAIRPITIGRNALVVLTPMPGRAVMAIEPNARPVVGLLRTHGLGFTPTLATRGHLANVRVASNNRIYESNFISKCSRRCGGGTDLTPIPFN